MQMVLRAVSAAEAPQSLELGIDIPGYPLSLNCFAQRPATIGCISLWFPAYHILPARDMYHWLMIGCGTSILTNDTLLAPKFISSCTQYYLGQAHVYLTVRSWLSLLQQIRTVS